MREFCINLLWSFAFIVLMLVYIMAFTTLPGFMLLLTVVVVVLLGEILSK